DSAQALLQYLEGHAGRPLRTRTAIDAYLATLPAPAPAPAPTRSLLRETALVLFLVVAVLQYYYIDVSLQIASLRGVTVFVPTAEVKSRSDAS
ncbi:MAG: hypothetical protein R3357_12305, partial [Burkholderiales bacterium]|nr:hypothetical protein [Burkholderiales bacterium]